MMYYYYNHPTFGVLDSVLSILFWVLIVWLIVLLFRRAAGPRAEAPWRNHMEKVWGPTDKNPLDILKERYAKGEINKQEFDEKKRDIGV